VIEFLNLTLESSLREEVGQTQTDAAIDCVLVLGHIKFQLVVDRNSDRDLDVGGIPITASVAWAAQQLTANAFQEKSNAPDDEWARVRLFTAAAWLSPVEDPSEDVVWGGEKLRIQGRDQFIKEIEVMLKRHVHGARVLDNTVLVNLIHGMHASIPRGGYWSATATIPFPQALCEGYDSPWSEDESVLRALITYALDLLSPPERKRPLVEREIKFSELASELMDRLFDNNASADVIAFGFWLTYRVPYVFKSRKTMLADICHIWTSVVEPLQDNMHRQRWNFLAVDAFVAVAQCHVSTRGVLPKFTHQAALRLLNAALESGYSRPMATYAIAMILNLGKSNQVSAVTNGIKVETFIETLFSASDDPEKGTTEEDVVDLCIYSTLILFKLRPTVNLDVGRVKGLVGQMEKTVGDPSVGDSGVAERTGADADADLDRVRWKAIYLSALVFPFVPDDAEREKHTEGLRERVLTLVGSGELPVVGDCEHCLEPLDMYELELRAPTAEHPRPIGTVFEAWIDEFPLFPLVGSVATVKT